MSPRSRMRSERQVVYLLQILGIDSRYDPSQIVHCHDPELLRLETFEKFRGNN